MLALLSPYLIKAGLIGVACLGIIGGGFWFVHHERDKGAARCVADVKAATEKEQKRQGDINQTWQQWADGAVQNADTQRADYDAKLKAISTATADDRAVCVFSPVADKLRALGRPGGKANPHAAPSRVKP